MIAKKLSGEASPEELDVLETLLRQKPDLHYPLQAVHDLWHPRQHDDFDQQQIIQAFQRHIDRMKESGVLYDNRVPAQDELLIMDEIDFHALRPGRLFRKAALALLSGAGLILLGYGIFRNPAAPPAKESLATEAKNSEIATLNGSRTSLHLPDGTQVWLNAGSKITYEKDFGQSTREVLLTGEAFFDVVRNKDKPFVIHTSHINIKVLGTTFNVKSYPSDKTTEASLIRGSIEVTLKDKPDKKIILKPNEKIVVDNGPEEKVKAGITHPENHEKVEEIPDAAIRKLTYENKTGAIIETSWVENKLIFQDESFEEIARQLERWYGVTIKFENGQLKENHLTGSFRNETIHQALDALKFTASFNYEIDGKNNVTIY